MIKFDSKKLSVCVLMYVLSVSCVFFSKYYAETEGLLKSWVGFLWQEDSSLTCGKRFNVNNYFWQILNRSLIYSYPCASLAKEYLTPISGIIFSFSNYSHSRI